MTTPIDSNDEIARLLIGFRNEVQRATRDGIVQPGTKVLPNIENSVEIIKNAHEYTLAKLNAMLVRARIEELERIKNGKKTIQQFITGDGGEIIIMSYIFESGEIEDRLAQLTKGEKDE